MIKDKGILELYNLAKLNSDTLVNYQGRKIDSKWPFKDLESIQKKNKFFYIKLKEGSEIYSTSIPKYSFGIVPGYLVSNLGTVKATRDFQFEAISIPGATIFELTSGKISVESHEFLKPIIKKIGGISEGDIYALSIIEGESGFWGYGLVNAVFSKFYDTEGNPIFNVYFSYGFFDLEKEKLYINEKGVPEDINDKAIEIEKILEERAKKKLLMEEQR